MSYSLPLAVPVSGEHNSSEGHGGVLTIHSKDAHGSGEHAGPGNWTSTTPRS